MGAFSGPQSNTGLILCLDAANRKSFAGTGSERTGSLLPTFGNWGGLVGTSTAYSGTYGGTGVYLEITAANGGGVNWWYGSAGGTACLPSTQYTISAIIRYEGNVPNANLFYVRQFNSSAAQTSESGKYTSANQVYIGNGQYLAWATFVTDATAASFYVHGYDYANIRIWLENLECKLSGLSNLGAASNHGTLTGTMTRSASSGGVIQFSGANDIRTGLNLTSGPYTVIAASRYTVVGGRIITAVSNNWLMGHWSNTTENHYAVGWVTPSSSGSSDTNWRILAASGNSTTDSWQMYVNGVQTFSNNVGSAGPNNIGINVYSSERCTGEVGFLLAYNRVLSPTEIAAVFNAYRGRYGI